MKLFSSKEIRFSGNSIKSCVGFIDLVDSTKNTMTMDNLEQIRKYYSKFINSISKIVKSYGGKVIKNIGDCLLLYFPKLVILRIWKHLLIILDIRMKNLNGFQLHQQIKSIDPTIKLLFVTALDISDELLIIVPGLSKEQILKKPVDRKVFTNTVKNY
jgi:two-component SAPR family response regulator